ncbi:MAG: ATPase with chaperone activity [Caldimonas sp.]
MDDLNQFDIPDSFVALYMTPGRLKPTAARATIAERYELCEDLASHLFEHARAQHHDLGIAEDEVLRRCHLGLRAESSGLDEREAGWVIRRLAELEGWEALPLP